MRFTRILILDEVSKLRPSPRSYTPLIQERFLRWYPKISKNCVQFSSCAYHNHDIRQIKMRIDNKLVITTDLSYRRRLYCSIGDATTINRYRLFSQISPRVFRSAINKSSRRHLSATIVHLVHLLSNLISRSELLRGRHLSSCERAVFSSNVSCVRSPRCEISPFRRAADYRGNVSVPIVDSYCRPRRTSFWPLPVSHPCLYRRTCYRS